MGKDIIVVTAAYGTTTVENLGGQTALLPIIAGSGADGVEIRRELFTLRELAELPTLAKAIEGSGLFAVYSAPEALFEKDGTLNPRLSRLLGEAQVLNARWLKLSLGQYEPESDLLALAPILANSPVQLVVENDQTPDCGIITPLRLFFTAIRQHNLPVQMTFDMANWLWVGESALEAAELFADDVSYIHVKAAEPYAKGWRAVSLDESDGAWRAILANLPRHVPRGIEFPLQGSDLTAVTRYYVEQLRVESR